MDAAQPKWKTVTFWVLSILVALTFLAAGIPKLMGAQQAVEGFAQHGYPGWFLRVTGTIEAGSAILVLIPRTRFYGAALLMCTMTGAMITHLRLSEFDHLPAPVVLFTLNAILAWNHRPARLKRQGTPGAAGA